MIELVLSDADLTGLRFAVSPLNELTLSLRVLTDPGRYPLHLPWSRRLVDLRPDLDLPVLTALINDRGWTPDFLSPRPTSPFTQLDEELTQLRATPPHVVRRDLRAIHRTIPPALTGRRVLDRIVEALEHYWKLAIGPHWTRMRTVLESDIAYRGRLIAHGGLAAMLTDISSRISFDSPIIRVRIHGVPPRRIEIAGAGLTLVPTVFALHTGIPVDPSAPPLLIYAARGVGILWETPTTPSPTALIAILGRTRSTLLTMLTEPASSTDLARRTRVTTSAVNQHLRALHAAGLLTSHRHGRSVLYQRSDLGNSMLSAIGDR